jgi:hypothetical protein
MLNNSNNTSDNKKISENNPTLYLCIKITFLEFFIVFSTHLPNSGITENEEMLEGLPYKYFLNILITKNVPKSNL